MITKKIKNQSVKKVYGTWNDNYYPCDGIYIANPTNEDIFGKNEIDNNSKDDLDDYVFLENCTDEDPTNVQSFIASIIDTIKQISSYV